MNLMFGGIVIGIVALSVYQIDAHSQIPIPENAPSNRRIVENLVKIVQLNRIRYALIAFDGKNHDISQLFLSTIAHRVDSTFQWQLIKTQYRQASLPPASVPQKYQLMANSQTRWIIVLMSDINFDNELLEYTRNAVLRNTFHLSLVMVINENRSATVHNISEFIVYVWNLVQPIEFITMQCNGDVEPCASFRYDPEMGLNEASTYDPQPYSAARQLNRIPNCDANELIVKFNVNHLAAFPIVDVSDNNHKRLVGFNVWLSALLADMLDKRLHFVVADIDKMLAKDNDTAVRNLFRKKVREIYTNSIMPTDRLPAKITYMENYESMIRYVF